MKKIFAMTVAALALTGCATRQTASDEAVENVAAPNIIGKWNIENVVISDSINARPYDINPEEEQYITFDKDSTIFVQTNCNTISGNYVQNGSGLSISDNLMMTRMACPDMQVETYLGRILPNVNEVDVTNDSTIRLNTSDPSQYVVLTKAK